MESSLGYFTIVELINFSDSPSRVVIIGGGITGLTVAYRLHQLIKKNKLPIEVNVARGS